MEDNLHAGHRQRLTGKFLQNSNSLAEHELVELLLFPALPRINTNPIAHNLLKTFGTISRIFSATKEELMSIDGVGEKVATHILVVSKLSDLAHRKTIKEKSKKYDSFETSAIEFRSLFSNFTKESLFMILLDGERKKITQIEFKGNSKFCAEFNIKDITSAIAINRPTYVIFLHNHPSGDFQPSTQDDKATKQLDLICSLQGATMVDHVIVTREDMFSYRMSKRLDALRDKYTNEKILTE
jgi:DNA repair protein RadC